MPIRQGAVMCQATVALPGELRVSSVMTLNSLKELGIRQGSTVTALVKAANDLLASD